MFQIRLVKKYKILTFFILFTFSISFDRTGHKIKENGEKKSLPFILLNSHRPALTSTKSKISTVRTLFLCLSLEHTHTHTHTLSLSLSHIHTHARTHTLSLSHSLTHGRNSQCFNIYHPLVKPAV